MAGTTQPQIGGSSGGNGGKVDDGDRKRSFKVLTYNLWIAPLVRWHPSENLEAICDFIRSTDPDLVCLQEVFDWRLGPLGFLCEKIFGGGTGWGPISWLFYFEGLLLPFFQTNHQARIISTLLPSLPYSLPSAPIPFARGHNQGLLVLSKHVLHRPLARYLPGVVVHTMGTQAFTLYPSQGEGRRKDAKEGIRFVNLHLVPNFETHPWKGRLLGWLGEKDVPRLQRQQLAAIGQEMRREGGEEGRWCAVGDFNVHGPEVLGVGSRVTEVTCPKEQHVLDHLVTALPYTYTVFPNVVLSDHYPVLATLEL
ncbi:hypothetical protein VYU27_005805 [Nannochloropsis oceanica]